MAFERPTDEELAYFVEQSNMIEGEPTESEHPLFVSHLNAARHAADVGVRGRPLDPRDIHATIMAPEPGKMPGRYRTVRVWVGSGEKLDPEQVPSGMDMLYIATMNTLRASYQGVLQGISADAAWNLHHWFESIHPFIDGNGRTGRTWMNYLRLRMGSPWLTVTYRGRWDYYDLIASWEREHPL